MIVHLLKSHPSILNDKAMHSIHIHRIISSLADLQDLGPEPTCPRLETGKVLEGSPQLVSGTQLCYAVSHPS